ncbi:hypothetical protein KsCSTR_37670 [Candidatus Kuenenia stuttgartiensis]|uniref:Uncharacterized protein n=1 Tax=Kuenenia stuttgartiensis TaxID=174633 RepID=Q1Q653_KUEST|nr:hypothetical protein KsCSTR_37670 [Candidatus Kuenenia stuttgartiensis]CAJ73055.1 unknown protein [Candidatus Kuenenia stuttgartiensis]
MPTMPYSPFFSFPHSNVGTRGTFVRFRVQRFSAMSHEPRAISHKHFCIGIPFISNIIKSMVFDSQEE